jgi:2-phospho-L-lactate guanylyltransferase
VPTSPPNGPSSTLPRLHAIVPVRSIGDGKARLGLALDAEERAAIVVGLLRRTLEVIVQVPAIAAVNVVSADPTLLALARLLGATAVREEPLASRAPETAAADSLNAALRQGRAAARASGATSLLYLPADLPLLSVAALERLLDAADAALTAGAGRPIVVIAPSDARGGTNALLLAPLAVVEPCFGPASLAAHLRAAAESGATVQLVADPEIGFDLDTPDDLERLDPARLVELEEMGAATLDELAADALATAEVG